MNGINIEETTRNFSELIDWAGENRLRASLLTTITSRVKPLFNWINLIGIAYLFDLAILLYLAVFAFKITDVNAVGYLKKAYHNHATLTRAISKFGIDVRENHDNLKNQEAWKIFVDASAREGSSNPNLLYAIWQAETGSVDCELESACISGAGALGPCQFLPSTWDERDESGKLKFRDEDWDIWSLEDCSRAMARLIHYLNMNSWQNLQSFQRSSAAQSDARAWNRWLPGFVQAQDSPQNTQEVDAYLEEFGGQDELEKISGIEQYLVSKMKASFERALASEEVAGMLVDPNTQYLLDRIFEKVEGGAHARHLNESTETNISAPVDDRIDLPVKGPYRITSRIGPKHPDGVDLAQTRGVPFDVYAACTGTITRVNWWQVEQTCDGYPGMMQAYWHVVPHVRVGDRVERGQRVATTGKTRDGSSWGGSGAGVHLHWLTIINGVHQNPFATITHKAGE